MTDYVGELPEGIEQVGEGAYLIQGKPATSSWEVSYCIALSNANHTYEYLAAWWLPDGPLEIDVRLMSVPPKTYFIFLDGGHWHDGGETANDQWERQRLYIATKNFANFPVTVTDPDLQTYEACWAHVVRTFGRR